MVQIRISPFALTGPQMNAISERDYALVIFMTGVTTLVAPPLVKLLFQPEREAVAVPISERASAM